MAQAETYAPCCTVVSADGTTIGYKLMGRGPAVVLLHGGMQSSDDFTELGQALANRFTVVIPDRRGRGASGDFGPRYGMAREREDLVAVLAATGATRLFGLSSGALIALDAALSLPGIERVALYEPPLPVEGTEPAGWAPRFDREIAQGDVVAAFVTVLKGVGEPAFIKRTPRALLVPLLRRALRREHVHGPRGPVALEQRMVLTPTMHYDARLVGEMDGVADRLGGVGPEVLLLGGDKSVRWLGTILDAMEAGLPRARRLEIPGAGHTAPGNGGRPDLVATALERFFAGP